MNYAPRAAAKRVVGPGEFRFSAVGLMHGHISGMCHGLRDAGGEIVSVYDPDPQKVEAFRKAFPEAKAARCEEEVLEDPSVRMVASADIPSLRGPLGLRAMEHGKHFFVDKAPFTTLSQLEMAEATVRETGLIWAVCYSERLQSEAGVYAGQLVHDGAIGRVVQVMGTGPHRLSAKSRPPYFFDKEQYGGILCDIGSHQAEQFLYYAGCKGARVVSSHVANYNHPEYPGLEDFGDALIQGDNGAMNYFRVDWFTPDGLRTWGDGRTFILGTDGYIELRKYVNVGAEAGGDHVFLVDGKQEHHFQVKGQVGFPYFGQLILDCLHGTDEAMPQAHTFLAARLCLEAQAMAVRVE